MLWPFEVWFCIQHTESAEFSMISQMFTLTQSSLLGVCDVRLAIDHVDVILYLRHAYFVIKSIDSGLWKVNVSDLSNYKHCTRKLKAAVSACINE